MTFPHNYMSAPDVLEASRNRYFILWPVPAADWWSPGYPGSPPYGEGAENAFAFNDVYCGVLPCYSRNSPWRYIENPNDNPSVPAGLRLIYAESTAPPKLANMTAYSHYYDLEMPPDPIPWFGCAVEWPDPNGYFHYVENFIRFFQRGKTATVRYDWAADEEERGWWVEYVATVDVWLAHSYMWIWSGCVRPEFFMGGECWTRWSAWYEGKVHAKWNGSLEVAAYRQFIEAQDSKYGLRFEPYDSKCNDVLYGCTGLADGMGDVPAPSQTKQMACIVPEGPHAGRRPPCLQGARGLSYAYCPDPPIALDQSPSMHVVTHEPQFPHGDGLGHGLIHRIRRTMLDDSGADAEDGGESWGQLIFARGMPFVEVG